MGLHQRYATILGNKTLTLAAPIKDELREELRNKFAKMMSALFKQKGANFDINIIASDEAQDFINTHTSVLDSSFQKVEMSDLMRQRLTRSNYIFSGMKTFHELNEAFPSLLDENGNKKTFERFLNDVRKIDETYNSNYLRAEYNFVQASAEMAAKWEKFMEDGDHYYLQYRTQHDDKVRPEHASLDRVTLPPSDSFWESYYPPNGWNCRCTVVQVLKRKYEPTPHDEAMSLGEDALQTDKKGIFRFNSGKEQKTVPDYNPYTIKRCRDCDIAKGKATLAFIPDYQLCRACVEIRECYQKAEKRNKENLPKLTPQEKHEIYSQPIGEQFKDIAHKDASGHVVLRHTLKDKKEMDYNRVLDSAILFSQKEDVRIMPEIHASETSIRNLLGLPEKKNPDLAVGNMFVDVKSPFSEDGISSNASKAAKQGARVCITDHLCILNENNIDLYARWVFKNPTYPFNEAFFVINGKLYEKRRLI